MALEPNNALVELFILDCTNLGGDVYHWHAGTNEHHGPITWQGQVYQAWPVQASGFELDGTGKMPRPKIRLANADGTLSALMKLYGDCVGATIYRKRTRGMYLDAVNFSDGNATADPTEEMPDDKFFVEQKTDENPSYIEFELSGALDINGAKLPARTFMANTCLWQYRGPECGYTGSACFDAADNVVTDPSKDKCGKRLSSCKCRFGSNATLPFGGFPAVGAMS